LSAISHKVWIIESPQSGEQGKFILWADMWMIFNPRILADGTNRSIFASILEENAIAIVTSENLPAFTTST
jgi:hypothetical protein